MKKGDFVVSQKGRDQGRIFVVTETEDNFVYLCDGSLRKQDKQKKKKIKHVKELGFSDPVLCEKMAEEKANNADFRKAILNYSDSASLTETERN